MKMCNSGQHRSSYHPHNTCFLWSNPLFALRETKCLLRLRRMCCHGYQMILHNYSGHRFLDCESVHFTLRVHLEADGDGGKNRIQLDRSQVINQQREQVKDAGVDKEISQY